MYIYVQIYTYIYTYMYMYIYIYAPVAHKGVGATLQENSTGLILFHDSAHHRLENRLISTVVYAIAQREIHTVSECALDSAEEQGKRKEKAIE